LLWLRPFAERSVRSNRASLKRLRGAGFWVEGVGARAYHEEEKMRRRVIITAPRLTPEETGRLYGVSKRRTKHIIDMVEKSLAKKGYLSLYYNVSSANKNGAKRNGAESQDVKARVHGRAKRGAKARVAEGKKSRPEKAKTSR